jgi:hypothetical protein
LQPSTGIARGGNARLPYRTMPAPARLKKDGSVASQDGDNEVE